MMIRKKTRWKRSRKKAAFFFFFLSRALESFAPHSRSKKRSSLALRSWRHATRRRTFPGCRGQRTERAARSTARIKKKVQTQFEERKNVVGEREDERGDERSRLAQFLSFRSTSFSTYQRERGVRGDEGREGGGAGHQLGDGGGLFGDEKEGGAGEEHEGAR